MLGAAVLKGRGIGWGKLGRAVIVIRSDLGDPTCQGRGYECPFSSEYDERTFMCIQRDSVHGISVLKCECALDTEPGDLSPKKIISVDRCVCAMMGI